MHKGLNPGKLMQETREGKRQGVRGNKKKKFSVILSFIDFKPSNKNRRKPDLFTGSIAIAQKSLKQWEVNGKGIIAVFYVPFLPLSFMSPEKDFTVSKMQHNFKTQQHSCIYTRRPLKHTNSSCLKKKTKSTDSLIAVKDLNAYP